MERERHREKERPPAYSPADLKCVLSRAIFSVRKWAKVTQEHCRKQKKNDTL